MGRGFPTCPPDVSACASIWLGAKLAWRQPRKLDLQTVSASLTVATQLSGCRYTPTESVVHHIALWWEVICSHRLLYLNWLFGRTQWSTDGVFDCRKWSIQINRWARWIYSHSHLLGYFSLVQEKGRITKMCFTKKNRSFWKLERGKLQVEELRCPGAQGTY